MQARWDAVTVRCRAEILSRIEAAGTVSAEFQTFSRSDAGDEDSLGEDDADDELEDDWVSVREALRVADEAFQPDISDAKLVDLYLLVDAFDEPDGGAFDEIFDAVRDMLFERLQAGTPEVEPTRHIPGFDPHEDERALAAVIEEQLSHAGLVMLYLVSRDNSAQPETGHRWRAITDLCRAQILRRMSPPRLRPGRGGAELLRRVLAHSQAAASSVGGRNGQG